MSSSPSDRRPDQPDGRAGGAPWGATSGGPPRGDVQPWSAPGHGHPPQGHPQQGYAAPAGPPLGCKDTTVAYLLWFFLGQLGGHKLYLRQPVQGLLYLGLALLGWATAWLLVGWLLLVPLFVLLLVDAFTMPGRVRRVNADIYAAVLHGRR